MKPRVFKRDRVWWLTADGVTVLLCGSWREAVRLAMPTHNPNLIPSENSV